MTFTLTPRFPPHGSSGSRVRRAGLPWLLALSLSGCAHTPAASSTPQEVGAQAPQSLETQAASAQPQVAQAPAPAPRRWEDEVLYFVVLDRFADGDPSNNVKVDPKAKGAFHGGDLKGLTAHLDELSSLGVTALWITPVVKNIDGFVTGAGFPDWGYHGYWADDFTQVDPRFGTEEDLRTLVKESHARGIRVLLDVVYNHPGYNSRYLLKKDMRGWLRSEERGDCGPDDITSCVSGLPDFKTEQPEVARFLLDAQLEWARRSGVDGFRLDTVKHVAMDFWKEHRRRTRGEVSPDFFLLGEVWGGDAESLDPWFSSDAMDGGFDFGFQGSALAFVQGRGRTVAFDRYLKSRHKVRKGYHLSHFLSSHDVKGALLELGGDMTLFRLAATLQLTTQGIPVIYYGEEVGRPGGDWPDNRGDMPWGERPVAPGAGLPRDEGLRAYYQKLIAIRRAHPALSRGTHTALSTEGDVYVFQRHDAESGDAVVVAINRGKTPASVSVPWPTPWAGAAAEDLLGQGQLAPQATLQLSVEPQSARILGRAAQ